MLLLLHEKIDRQQVFEIHVPPAMKREKFTKLGEVRWTRLIPLDPCANMYLVGIRFLFEHPALG